MFPPSKYVNILLWIYVYILYINWVLQLEMFLGQNYLNDKEWLFLLISFIWFCKISHFKYNYLRVVSQMKKYWHLCWTLYFTVDFFWEFLPIPGFLKRHTQLPWPPAVYSLFLFYVGGKETAPNQKADFWILYNGCLGVKAFHENLGPHLNA